MISIKNPKKVIIAGVIALAVGMGAYFSLAYLKTKGELSQYEGNNSIKAIKEKDELLKKLEKNVLIPQDEEPSIATVTDAFRLRGQKFFEQAENGDKVVVFSNAQRAILYRPSTEKIIEVAPVNIDNASQAVDGKNKVAGGAKSENYVLGDSTEKVEDTPKEPEEPARLAVYNGTTVSGLASDVKAYLENRMGKDKINVVKVDNANEAYDETVIINVSDKYNKLATEIEGIINGQILEKPEDVNFPDVDLIIIAGKDIDIDDLIN